MSQLRSIQPIKGGLGLRELQAVLAIAELGSFRAAAAALGFTQSALSHQVSALEAALGQSLFHRPGGRAAVRLTPAGEAVCRRARRALAEVEAVAADAEQAARGESVRVRIGVTQTSAAEIMPAALRVFRDDHPGVEAVLVAADEPQDSPEAPAAGEPPPAATGGSGAGTPRGSGPGGGRPGGPGPAGGAGRSTSRTPGPGAA